LVALLLGVSAGTITGLLPGIHINLVAVFLLSISAFLLNYTSPIVLIIFIVSLSITHTFLDNIPSIMLGAPNSDTALSVLPGHKLLLEGKGYFALVFTLYGTIAGLFLILFFTPLFLIFLRTIYPIFQNIMFLILITVSAFSIFTSKKKILSLMIFLLAGVLGFLVLNLGTKEPLLPLFTGLFGASSLIVSIKNKTKIQQQKIEPIKKIRLSKKSLAKTISASILASPLASFLPGLGSSQAAVIAKEVIGETDEREFLFLIGALNTLVMGLSFITLYSINKTRTGSAVAVQKLIPELSSSDLFLIISAILISGILSFFLTIQFSKFFSKNIHKINYSSISIFILIIVSFFVTVFSGPIGILIFITSAALGIFTITSEIERIHLMGCLLIPTIIYYI